LNDRRVTISDQLEFKLFENVPKSAIGLGLGFPGKDFSVLVHGQKFSPLRDDDECVVVLYDFDRLRYQHS